MQSSHNYWKMTIGDLWFGLAWFGLVSVLENPAIFLWSVACLFNNRIFGMKHRTQKFWLWIYILWLYVKILKNKNLFIYCASNWCILLLLFTLKRNPSHKLYGKYIEQEAGLDPKPLATFILWLWLCEKSI